jgi:arabinofuranosyltransferase
LALVGAAMIAVLFGFTADDAFIVHRYAQNLLYRGALEYNWGEPINALTSPLHVFVVAALEALSPNAILANKIVGLLAMLATLVIGWRSIGSEYAAGAGPEGSLARWFQIIFVIVVGLSPFVGLWTVGGLETPYVTLLITSLAVLVRKAAHKGGVTPSDCVLIGFLVGLSFLGRFDTALLTAPIVLWLLLQSRERPWIIAALVPGAIAPVGWLIFSYIYFHDILPTSFYTKSPQFHPGVIAKDAFYTLEFLVLSGILVLALPPLCNAYRSGAARSSLIEEVRRVWPLWLGAVLLSLYGLTTATVHMMFGFRMFLPYLPTAALLVFGLWPASRAGLIVGRRTPAAFAGAMVAVQAVLTFVVHSVTANPVPRGIAEFSDQSEQAFMKQDLATLIASTDDIKAHWARQPESRVRGPRIQGPAAGVVPWLIPDAYVYEVLASARHDCEIDAKYHADYVQLISPRMGTPETAFPSGWTEADVISRRSMIFDGNLETVIVFYNRNPRPNILPPYVDQPCLDDGERTVGSAGRAK